MTTGSTAMAMEIESLRQQRARCVWQIVMLRDALKEVQMVAESSVKTHGYDKQHVRNADVAKRALAATADLAGVILCHAEPIGWCGTSGVGELIVSKSKIWNFLTTPLYRAWEPK